jgi:hypothetical protein
MLSELPQQCGAFKINKCLSFSCHTATIFKMGMEIDPLAVEVAQELTVDEQNPQPKPSATWIHQELAQVTN